MLALEEPAPGSVYSGVSNVRGWAVAPQGLTKIELYVDGALQGNIPLGGRRADVGAAYPSYPGSADSGFAMAYNYSNLAAGSHTLAVRAYDNAGGARDASAAFAVARFASSFLADPAAVNLDQATLARSGNTIAIQNLLAAGQPYTAQLTWRPATQGFALTQIAPAGGAPAVAAGPGEPTDLTGTTSGQGSIADPGATITPRLSPVESIVLALEEPAPGSVYSGISNVRGWAVAPAGMQKIELYLDSQLLGNIPLGGKRADVGAAYPSYPGSADSGFAMAYNYSNLAAGSHTLAVRAYDNAGGARDASAAFAVARFASSFLADPAAVNLDQATLARSGNTIAIQNLLAAGQPYTAQLAWRPATQGFALTQIAPAGGGGGECNQAITPTSQAFDYLGGAGTVAVSTPAGCAWTAQSHDEWITITTGASGSGPGTVTYTVAVNASGARRTGTLTVAGQTHTVSQTPKSDEGGGGGK